MNEIVVSLNYDGNDPVVAARIPEILNRVGVMKQTIATGGLTQLRRSFNFDDVRADCTFAGGLLRVNVTGETEQTSSELGVPGFDWVPDFVSGLLTQGYTLNKTAACAARHSGDEFHGLGIDYDRRAPMYSGLMRKVVQVVHGTGAYGVNYPLPYRSVRDKPLTFQTSYEKSVLENGVVNHYACAWNNSDGIVYGPNDSLWVVKVSVGELLAMPLPLWEASTTEEFANWVRAQGLEDVQKALDLFGGVPSGEGFPADTEAAIRAGRVVRLGDASEVDKCFTRELSYTPVRHNRVVRVDSYHYYHTWAFGDRPCEARNDIFVIGYFNDYTDYHGTFYPGLADYNLETRDCRIEFSIPAPPPKFIASRDEVDELMTNLSPFLGSSAADSLLFKVRVLGVEAADALTANMELVDAAKTLDALDMSSTGSVSVTVNLALDAAADTLYEFGHHAWNPTKYFYPIGCFNQDAWFLGQITGADPREVKFSMRHVYIDGWRKMTGHTVSQSSTETYLYSAGQMTDMPFYTTEISSRIDNNHYHGFASYILTGDFWHPRKAVAAEAHQHNWSVSVRLFHWDRESYLTSAYVLDTSQYLDTSINQSYPAVMAPKITTRNEKFFWFCNHGVLHNVDESYIPELTQYGRAVTNCWDTPCVLLGKDDGAMLMRRVVGPYGTQRISDNPYFVGVV